MKTNVPRGQLPTIILSALLDGDKYGLEIISKIKTQSNGMLEIKQPTLYSTLTRLEKQAFINSYWRESELGGKRHYYSITDLGKKQFEAQNGTFYTDFWEKNAENRTTIAQAQKYDEIGGLNFSDEGLVVQNTEFNKNQGEKIQNIENELKNLGLSSTSFFENLKNEETTPTSFQHQLEKDEKPQINDFEENQTEEFQDEEFITEDNYEDEPASLEPQIKQGLEKTSTPKTDDGVFLKPHETIEPSIRAKHEPLEKLQPKDDGKFIEEKINPIHIPPVKKIEGARLESRVTPPIMSKIKPPERDSYQDKILSLYEKSRKPATAATEVAYQAQSIEELRAYYKEKNIKFFEKNGEVDKMDKTHFSVNTHSLLYKYLTIFGLVILETIACLIGFYLLDGKIDNAFLYAIFPVLSSLPVAYYVLKSRGLSFVEYDKKSFLLSLLIFLVVLAIIYCVNLPLGITFAEIPAFKSTFIYPSIIATNILISAVFDAVISKRNKG